MSQQMISVVIPAYNEQEYIECCLISLQNQTRKPEEIIVVDNNCTDKTIAIAKKFPVKIVKEKKQGLIFARNTGFNSARGDIIVKLDADSKALPNLLSDVEKSFADSSVVAVSSHVFLGDLPFVNEKAMWPSRLVRTIFRHATRGDVLFGPQYALRKSAWEKIRDQVCLDDSLVHEDIDITIHLRPLGKIHFIETALISASSRRITKNPLSFFIEYPIRLSKTVNIHQR